MEVHYGRNFVLVKLPEPIVVDVDEDGDEAFQKTYLLKLNKAVDVIAIDSFFGHDRGDAYEMAIEAFSDTDQTKVEHARDFLWRRIDEDTAPNNDEHKLYVLPRPMSVKALKVHLTCRVTGKNDLVDPPHPSAGKWRGVFDFNMYLITR